MSLGVASVKDAYQPPEGCPDQDTTHSPPSHVFRDLLQQDIWTDCRGPGLHHRFDRGLGVSVECLTPEASEHNPLLVCHDEHVLAWRLDALPHGAEPLREAAAGTSRRSVQLPTMAVEALRTHRTRQLEQRLLAGPIWQDFGLVFTTGRGRPLGGNNVRTTSFAPLLEKAGLPPMRFHLLRHTAATLLMAEGVNVKIATEMLGHADISTTLRTYAHVLPDMQDTAAEAMDGCLRLAARHGRSLDLLRWCDRRHHALANIRQHHTTDL